MEPSHKDAETAAAVAAADPRGASSSSGVVVQVREKKGPLRAAIPYMPFPVAVICLFLNTFVPGLGKTRRPRPLRPGPRCGKVDREGMGETVGKRPRAASVRARAPSAPWQVAAARGAGAPESGAARSYPPRLHLLPPVNEVVPLRRARNFPGNTGARGWRRGWLPLARLGSPPGAERFCPFSPPRTLPQALYSEGREGHAEGVLGSRLAMTNPRA